MASVTSQTKGDVLVVYFTDAHILDETKIHELADDLDALADKCEHGKMLLNLGEVAFMSSSVLGKLVKLNKKCKAAEIKLKLCNIASDILDVFKITRLDKVFKIYEDEETALKDFE